jgi:hypothetical protein
MGTGSRVAKLLPLKNLLPSIRRKDRNLFMNGASVYTDGVLVSFEEEGPESCNCQLAQKRKKMVMCTCTWD